MNRDDINKIAVINVNGKAFFKNIKNPFLKLFLSNSKINEIECLIECKKQK